MAQKLFSTGPGSFSRAERKETIDDLEIIQFGDNSSIINTNTITLIKFKQS